MAGELKPPRVYIGLATLSWIFIWLLLTYIAIFLRPINIGIGMEIILWVPMLITASFTFMDNGKGLIHNVQYLIYVLWFIYLIPQMTGSLITS